MKIRYFVYVGEEFYEKSGTIMSSVYETTMVGDVSELERSDWGKIQIALMDGDTVHIYPASPSEKVWAYKQLMRYVESKSFQDRNHER